jgi:hypothetical protein
MHTVPILAKALAKGVKLHPKCFDRLDPQQALQDLREIRNDAALIDRIYDISQV